jgi:O-antigen/teichoic acid export membrane protein
MINSYTLIYLIANIVLAGIGFFALILYTHLLSPTEYGIYVIGASIAAVVTGVFFSWVRLSILRYQSRSPTLDLRSEAIIAYGSTVAVIAGLAPIAILVIRPSVGLDVVAGSLFMSFAFTAFEISQEFRRAKLNAVRFTTIALARSVLGLALGYVAIKLGGGGLGLMVAGGLSFLIVNAACFQSKTTKALPRISPDQFAKFVRYGLPFSVGAFAFALHGALDRLAIAYLLGESAAGQYGLPADMTRQLTAVLTGSVSSALFPIVFRDFAEAGAAATRERLQAGLEALLALIAPVAVGLAICANEISTSLLGFEFQSSAAALIPLLALGRMCGAINQGYVQISFQLAEKPLLQVAHDAIICILNLTLLIPMTLSFGLRGAAAAVLLAEASGIVIGLSLSRKAFKLPINFRGIARVLISVTALCLVLYLVRSALGSYTNAPLTLLCLILAGGMTYFGATLILNVAGLRSIIMQILLSQPESASPQPRRYIVRQPHEQL